MATRQPIDVLPDREADTLAEWLKAHPEITVITRDRFAAYAEAASRGAPQATQCAVLALTESDQRCSSNVTTLGVCAG